MCIATKIFFYHWQNSVYGRAFSGGHLGNIRTQHSRFYPDIFLSCCSRLNGHSSVRFFLLCSQGQVCALDCFTLLLAVGMGKNQIEIQFHCGIHKNNTYLRTFTHVLLSMCASMRFKISNHKTNRNEISQAKFIKQKTKAKNRQTNSRTHTNTLTLLKSQKIRGTVNLPESGKFSYAKMSKVNKNTKNNNVEAKI